MQFFNQEYFASSVRKGKSAVVAILYVKNYIKVLKIFLDKSSQKLPQRITIGQ